MESLKSLLTALVLCTVTVALADDVTIPTADDSTFDLSKGELTGSININGSGHIDNTHNGDKVTYSIDNQVAADFYRMKFKAGTQRDDAKLHVTLTSQGGSKVLDEEVTLTNNHNWTPNVQYVLLTGKMAKGKYTLVFDFISTENNYVCRVGDVQFRNPRDLQPGDEVPLQNPDFENGTNGWTVQNVSHRISNEHRGNHYSICENSKACSMLQTVEDLPDGLYLLEANAFDHVLSNSDLSYDTWRQADSVRTFLFMNDQQVLMKTVFDDRLNVANIYRWYKGVTGNYLYAGNGYYAPSSSGQDATALALEKGFYKNYLVAAVTGGEMTLGWRKTDGERWTWISNDNWRLTYLSTGTSLQDYAGELKQKPMSQQARQLLQNAVGRLLPNAVGKAEASARLWADIAAQRKIIEQQLDEKRAHHPRAVFAANAFLGESYDDYTDNEAFNYLYRLQEVQERLDYTYYNIEVETMGSLGDLILQQTENFADVKSLRVSGALNNEDLTILRQQLTELVDLDLSEAAVPELPDDALSHHSYLTWLALPTQLKTIGRSCFYEDWSLRTVQFPATLETIKPYAFYRCYNIGSADIPEGVTALGDNAYNQSGLQTVVLPATLQATQDNTFRDCKELYDVQLKGLTSIGGSTFYNCNHLTTIEMPATLKTIGDYSFEYCRRLATIELNEGLTSISHSAFNSNDSLRSITLPSTLMELYSTPFANCKNLTTIVSKAVAPPALKGEIPVSGSTPTVRVPVVSANVYKQADKWASLPIEDDATLAMPQDIYVTGLYNVSWTPEASVIYQPNVYLTHTSSYNTERVFGHVTVNSGAQLNAAQLNLTWNQQMVYDYVTRSWFASFINNGTARADNITVTMPMRKDFWYFISLPYDVRVGDIQCTDEGQVPFVVRGYDGFKRANRQNNYTWVNLTADDVMQAGKGYIFRSTNSESRNTNTFLFPALQNAAKPRFFNGEDVGVELAEYQAEYDFDRSWNFIGNPYPAFYDIRSMQTTAPITVYEWNQGWWGSTLKYVAYSPQDDDYILNPGQGFFMQRPLEGGTVVFRKDGRQHNTEARSWEYYSVNASRATAPRAKRQLFNLLLMKDGVQVDRARVVLNEDAALDYELSCDAAKFSSMEPNATELYIVEGGQHMAIDERPLGNGQVQLGLQLPSADTYTISFDTPSSEEVVLIDHAEGTQTTLAGGESYTFQAKAGTAEGRFTLRFGGAVDGISETMTGKSADDTWYDLQGRRVSQPQSGVYVRNGKKTIVK